MLTNLVYKSPDLAADYITQLAKTYRYILDKKFENLVPIRTELDFLESYLSSSASATRAASVSMRRSMRR